MTVKPDILDTVSSLKTKGAPFAVATVVRTVALTAAKAGAKATILSDGTISSGWIGGGCARAAVIKAAKLAMADGKPRLVSVLPPDLLKDLSVEPGQTKEGIEFAKNMCPSQGSMDVFVEPVLPRPQLVIFGASPVAVALADLGGKLDFAVLVQAPPEDRAKFVGIAGISEAPADLASDTGTSRFAVVATQGRGDEAALIAALALSAPYTAFVGSKKKGSALKFALQSKGVAAGQLAGLRVPAGLDLGAVTPEEIALSILGEIVQFRRRGQRNIA